MISPRHCIKIDIKNIHTPREASLGAGGDICIFQKLKPPPLLVPRPPPHLPQAPMSLVPRYGYKERKRRFKLKRKTAFLLQDDLPGVEPLQVNSCQQGVKDAGHHDNERQ